MKVNVLMSTYNGEKYIKEQIDSIVNQTIKDIMLTVRDDGSKDKTVEIVSGYSSIIPLTIIKGENLRCVKSFWELVRVCDEADYYSFADQDDVWDKDKLERAVSVLDKMDNSKPLLYCSDARITDENLNVIKEGLHEDFPVSFPHSLIMNICQGCTCVFNNKARELLKQIKPEDFGEGLHDWVAYRVIACMGEVYFDKKASLSYRQHGNNEIGASKKKSFIKKIKKAINKVVFTNPKDTRDRSDFAKTLLKLYEKDMKEEAKEIAKEFAFYREDKKLKKKLLKDKRFKFNGIKYLYLKLLIRQKKV